MEYLKKTLPDRFSDLLIEREVEFFSSTDVAAYNLENFYQSVPLSGKESRQDLVVTFEKIFGNHKILIDDFNELYGDSLKSAKDLTSYQIINFGSKSTGTEAMILSCESWRSVGLIFGSQMTKFGFYIGAFDDEGYILAVFDNLTPEFILSVYRETFP